MKLFDLARGVELGELQEHEDAVCALMFWGSHLITGCNDGQALESLSLASSSFEVIPSYSSIIYIFFSV